MVLDVLNSEQKQILLELYDNDIHWLDRANMNTRILQNVGLIEWVEVIQNENKMNGFVLTKYGRAVVTVAVSPAYLL